MMEADELLHSKTSSRVLDVCSRLKEATSRIPTIQERISHVPNQVHRSSAEPWQLGLIEGRLWGKRERERKDRE